MTKELSALMNSDFFEILPEKKRDSALGALSFARFIADVKSIRPMRDASGTTTPFVSDLVLDLYVATQIGCTEDDASAFLMLEEGLSTLRIGWDEPEFAPARHLSERVRTLAATFTTGPEGSIEELGDVVRACLALMEEAEMPELAEAAMGLLQAALCLMKVVALQIWLAGIATGRSVNR